MWDIWLQGKCKNSTRGELCEFGPCALVLTVCCYVPLVPACRKTRNVVPFTFRVTHVFYPPWQSSLLTTNLGIWISFVKHSAITTCAEFQRFRVKCDKPWKGHENLANVAIWARFVYLSYDRPTHSDCHSHACSYFARCATLVRAIYSCPSHF